VPVIFVPWAQHLLSKAVPQEGENILDVACGTGIVARMAKSRVGPSGNVAGVDLNSGMLNVAKSIVGSSRINCIEADVGNIPLESKSFDKAYCQQGLQFFPNKVGALKEIHRLLRSGGKCLVVAAQSLEQHPLMNSQVAALTKHIDANAAAGIRAVCSLPNGNEIAEYFKEAGFDKVSWETVDLTLLHKDGRAFIQNGIMSTPLAGIIATWSDTDRNALLDDILEGLSTCFDGKALTFPHISSVVMGTKA
jgi:ubiquinone/menaquinone biosynthesis C-methylase UbiE